MPAGIYLDEMFGVSAEQHALARAGAAGLAVTRANRVQLAARDPALLAYAEAQDLVLVTRNVQDFLRLNEIWAALRDWGLIPHPHTGILIPLGDVAERAWIDRVLDLLLHPNCPPLADQLLFWRVASAQWEVDQPYARRRRRPLVL